MNVVCYKNNIIRVCESKTSIRLGVMKCTYLNSYRQMQMFCLCQLERAMKYMLIYLPPEKWFYDVAPNKQNIRDIS